MAERSRGKLCVVGMGVRPAHLTPQTRLALEHAEKVFFLVPDPDTAQRILDLNGSAESLQSWLDAWEGGGNPYHETVEAILAPVRKGLAVCAAFPGHPGVLTYPAQLAVRQCRKEGYPVEMLPGVSVQDCLYADLGVDPGVGGCQSYEATDFLIHRRRFDPTSHLILWQVGSIGALSPHPGGIAHGLRVLAETLLAAYGHDHPVKVYDASTADGAVPRILDLVLEKLPAADVTATSVLYLPPREARPADPAVLARLGFTPVVPAR